VVVDCSGSPRIDLVDMHLHEENPDRIDECIKLYTEDAIWEAPARNVAYRGREAITETNTAGCRHHHERAITLITKRICKSP
jgi:hypothetical protein